ncbi:MAG: hypothetical protein P8101_18465, partial [Candidatus Thiodiazotropha sp.]
GREQDELTAHGDGHPLPGNIDPTRHDEAFASKPPPDERTTHALGALAQYNSVQVLVYFITA